MRALDTNVLARFFDDDDDDARSVKQRPAAVAAMWQRSYVSVRVLLEPERILRELCAFPPKEGSRAGQALVSIEHVTLEDRDAVLVAIDAYDRGLDFADALHLLRSSRASAFATFDRRLVKRASNLGQPLPAELLARGDR